MQKTLRAFYQSANETVSGKTGTGLLLDFTNKEKSLGKRLIIRLTLLTPSIRHGKLQQLDWQGQKLFLPMFNVCKCDYNEIREEKNMHDEKPQLSSSFR